MARNPGARGRQPTDTATPGETVLSVRELTKTYGDVLALDGVSFDVDRGSIVGLLGANGAGKTTCIKCMLGLVIPTAGSVEVTGVEVDGSPREAYRHVGAMLEGARNVYWRLTVRENLEFFAGLADQDASQARARHDRLLDRLGLADRADDTVNDLSRGMKQKVALACALSRDADVLFLDEPTLGLDVESSVELRRELRSLVAEESLTVVLSSHDMDVIEDLCDRVIILSSGEVLADDSVEALIDLFRTQAYRIVVSGEPSSSLEREFGREYGVERWTELGDRTRFTATLATGDDLYHLLGRLREAGLSVETVESVEPDLEEVFLELVGGGG